MRRFKALFKENVELLNLASMSGSLTASQKAWNAVVPQTLASYTQAGTVKHKRLTVYAHNGAVAARIKLMLPKLLAGLQTQGLEVTAIRVEVQVQTGTANQRKKPKQLSQEAAISIGTLAEKLGDSPLGEALTRLAKRADKS